MKTWTFGQKMLASFMVVVALSGVTCGVGVYALRAVLVRKDHVISSSARTLLLIERVRLAMERIGGSAQAFLLTGETKYLDQAQPQRPLVNRQLLELKSVFEESEQKALVATAEARLAEYFRALDSLVQKRQAGATVDNAAHLFDAELVPRGAAMAQVLTSLAERQERLVEGEKQAATDAAEGSVAFLIGVGMVSLVSGVVLAVWLTRVLLREVTTAIGLIQSSSTALQSAASQQASGSREQASATTEVSATIRELLATSRQIAEGAQRVVQIAESTATTARAGEAIVDKAQEGIASIKRQVDLVVTHMLELGKKSQQIGGILEIINELAEQTNILAINATIESAGAGEAGKRFAVVADEIRKLADRVGNSTKEIGSLIEDVRAASNTTVMATEQGSKSVDVGTRQFAEVTALFNQIADSVTTTTEAAREIELSTKQQTTAVEQVNTGISNVALATKEAESGSRQTMQTSSQLATLSRELGRLVRAADNT